MIGIAIVEDYENLIDMKLGDYVVGITVFAMLFIIMLMSIFVEATKHNGLLKMLRSIEENVETTVIRDGKEFLIKQSQVLVGDIIVLSGGDLIPADCLVIEANNQAQIDESYLTPDINPVQKKALKMSEY
jgi:P-type E1-E2 ATPase